ncbi:hypothetical protein L596_026854 [Steinernema carpocapsae]|uniref:Uncharacterized protein n=1 Tax=Steinernema carpocapsae TaxID=34508 RepID=A0A4U5M2N0_STECR|nr:hypothetical protein L596_026854 [Steinernema carpocapsae]
MLRCIVYVPPADILEAWEKLKNTLDPRIRPVAEYFQKFYIGSSNTVPMFPHNTWNMYSRLMDRRPRTNNQVEGFHNALASFFGVCHPNIFKFVAVIKGYAEKVDENIDDILAQRKGRNFSKVWRQTEEAKRSIANLTRFEHEI